MKSECVEPFSPPGQLGTAISDFTAGGVSVTKVCKICRVSLPTSSFTKSKTHRDRLRSECKTCKAGLKKAYYGKHPEKRNESMRRWVAKNREKVNAYQRAASRRVAAEQRSMRPAPSTCECGNGVHFRWFGKSWICVPCSTEKARQNQVKNNLKYHRRKGAKLWVERLRKRYGEPMAEAYNALRSDGAKSRVLRWRIVRRALPAHLHGINEGSVWRITTMNRIQGKPVWSTGWHCQHCNRESTDHRFFDLDHILARCRSGANSIANLQVLCPSCHRIKTISDLQGRKQTRKQLDHPAQDHWQAGTVTTIEGVGESNTPPTASATSLSQP